MVITLAAILAGLYTKNNIFHILSLVSIVVTIIMPVIFYPLAIVWFGLSKVMGEISSRLLLGLVFFLIVTPIGLLRRVMGKDRLNLHAFKRNNNSAFTERSHLYDASDLTNQF